jgi:hypothetical protein
MLRKFFLLGLIGLSSLYAQNSAESAKRTTPGEKAAGDSGEGNRRKKHATGEEGGAAGGGSGTGAAAGDSGTGGGSGAGAAAGSSGTGAAAPNREVNLKELGLWTNHFNFTLHGIDFNNKKFEPYAQKKSNLLRGIYESYSSRDHTPPSTHFAEVVILYKLGNNDTVFVSPIPEVFVSGNFAHTTYLTPIGRKLKDEVNYWPPYFNAKTISRELRSLGDCYDKLTSEHLKENGHLNETANPIISKVLQDFDMRGINLRTVPDGKGGTKAGWNNISSLYAHSEQAFISCVLQDKIPAVSQDNPFSITIVITGYHEPCDQCSKALKNLLHTPVFKDAFIRKLFPSTVEISKVRMNVLYVIADKKTIGDARIDLNDFHPYFIEARR